MKEKLRTIRAELGAKRDEMAVSRRDLDKAKASVASSKVTPLSKDPAFKEGQRAMDAVNGCQAEIDELQAAERGLLELLGEAAPPDPDGNGPGEAGVDAKTLTAEPGRWLSAVLGKRVGDVPNLSDEARRGAAVSAFGGGGIMAAGPGELTTSEGGYSTRSEAEAVIDLLAPLSVAMASGIGVLPIDKTETRVPRFTELPEAGWIAEMAPFPKSGPGIDLVESKPPKVGLVSILSLELFEDLSPLALALVQTQLLRAVSLAYDAGILFGDGEDDVPVGVAETSGIGVVEGELTDLSVFARGIAALVAMNARPGALVLNPLDFGTLLELTEFGGDTESRVPLIKATGGQGFTLDAFPGLRWWLTPAAPRGVGLMYDPAVIAAVIRKRLELAIDPYYGFDTGGVGLRVYLRGDVVVGQPDGVCLLDLGGVESS